MSVEADKTRPNIRHLDMFIRVTMAAILYHSMALTFIYLRSYILQQPAVRASNRSSTNISELENKNSDDCGSYANTENETAWLILHCERNNTIFDVVILLLQSFYDEES